MDDECTHCGGPVGVLCDVCADAYCPHCWMQQHADIYPCVYLCDTCAAQLPNLSNMTYVVNVTDAAGQSHQQLVSGGDALLKLFATGSATRMRVQRNSL